MKHYEHRKVEKKWQDFWVKNKTFAASTGAKKPKYYALDMFPYPSGAGLHVGHPEGYTATDIISRKRRHEGYEVLHPMGWDAFGLPAENYALKTGIQPAVSTQENIKTFKRQIQSLGFSYDWDREVDTTDPQYFKWSQWIFLQLYKKGLAYEKEMPMAWCPQCKIVVANEEVEAGKHERCGASVERKNLKQWMLKITEYADRLLADLDTLDEWPEKIRAMQRNWIGKSEGAEVEFGIVHEKGEGEVTVYTTRPDTLFGATYFVMSPEHPLVDEITSAAQKKEVEEYQKKASQKSDMERTELNKEKTGVFTGAYAVNPANEEKIPIWIADYVMMGYGTGAIMAVPAHDERDWEFAKKYDLPIKYVGCSGTGMIKVQRKPRTYEPAFVKKEENHKILTEQLEQRGEPYTSPYCYSINSGFLNGLFIREAKEKMIEWLEKEGKGRRKINYKLRDWIFTRQRYWGEPIPIIHCEKCGTVPVPESELPLELPKVDKYEPSGTGESPLANITDWVNTKCPKCGSPAKRETSTMPNWAGSSWYWLRFMDAKNDQEFCSKKAEKYWGPVDLYVGGAEHAVLHLLYARFWHKVLYDLGLVHTVEPFKKLVNQGLILAEDGQKMSKSLGNVVNPDEIVEKYGADTLRMYEMFMGPFEQSKAWSTGAVEGMYKFLQRIWRAYTEKPIIDGCPPDEKCALDTKKIVHQTIKKVTEDTDNFKFNTAISQFMICFNEVTQWKAFPRAAAEKLCILLAPYVPHMAEEIWHTALGHRDTLSFEPWPTYDQKYLVKDKVTYAVQINGKVRADFQISKDAGREEVLATAKEQEKVQKYLDGAEIVKEVFVPEKIVGFVTVQGG